MGSDIRKVASVIEDPPSEVVEDPWTRYQQTLRVGDEIRLGPSMKNKSHFDYVFRKRGASFEKGTRVAYAPFYDAWRTRQGQEALLVLPDNVARQILASLTTRAFETGLGG
jgi:hypothetical protein